MTLNILGAEYEIILDETIVAAGMDGCCQPYNKKIISLPQSRMLEDNGGLGDAAAATKAAKKDRYNEVLRHEIIHAFFHECGMEEYCDNENLVDWMAKQFPKLLNAFKETGCI